MKRKVPPAAARTVRILAELMAMVGLLLAVDQLWGGQNGFTHWQPNPYWVPVLVMAIVYGSWPGFTAAVLATLVWLATNDVSRTDTDYFTKVFDVSLLPMLWYTSAVIIGEVTDVRLRRIRRLELVRDIGSRNRDRIADAFQGLAQNNRVLQLGIATEQRTVSQALALAARLAHATGWERQSILRSMVTMACHSDNFTCYRLQAGRAWPVMFGDGCNGDRVPLLPALVNVLQERRAIIHAANALDRPLLADVGLVAVPILAPDEARLEGILVLHHMPFECLGPHLEAELIALAVWLRDFVADQSMLADFAVLLEKSS
ncbi:MAG: hypothetical protein WA085_01000 [Sphingobium sp.]|uniref:hypothetical protein n=1 Tax=Sphingobium sp. CECT 9361 TaxID=2845384 RepID=UPI001E59BC59|nr:hypothetical protein [Sphingobium sp. CECT 9361]CAH0355528.1 hypothetical protein SPH9361_03607 [Sphingobium sp. CECT 9361]